MEDEENFTVKLSVDFPGVSISRGLTVVEIIDNDKGITPVYNVMLLLFPLSKHTGLDIMIYIQLHNGISMEQQCPRIRFCKITERSAQSNLFTIRNA